MLCEEFLLHSCLPSPRAANVSMVVVVAAFKVSSLRVGNNDDAQRCWHPIGNKALSLQMMTTRRRSVAARRCSEDYVILMQATREHPRASQSENELFVAKPGTSFPKLDSSRNAIETACRLGASAAAEEVYAAPCGTMRTKRRMGKEGNSRFTSDSSQLSSESTTTKRRRRRRPR